MTRRVQDSLRQCSPHEQTKPVVFRGCVALCLSPGPLEPFPIYAKSHGDTGGCKPRLAWMCILSDVRIAGQGRLPSCTGQSELCLPWIWNVKANWAKIPPHTMGRTRMNAEDLTTQHLSACAASYAGPCRGVQVFSHQQRHGGDPAL